jgi:hypothetical protein
MMNVSSNLTMASTARALDPSPTPPVHGEVLRLRENISELSNVIDALTGRLDTVLRAVPPGDSKGMARRAGESALQDGLIDQNDAVEHQTARLRSLIDRLTV